MQDIIWRLCTERKKNIQINKKNILKRINENMTFDNLEINFKKNIWNLFFHSGYLTLTEEYNELKKILV